VIRIAKPITGEVIAIADEYTLVLNVGREDGVVKGMHFQIVEEFNIEYPETGEVIKGLEFPKAEVEVISVQDKSCVAQSSAIEARVEEAEIFRVPRVFAPRRIEERKPLPLSKKARYEVTGLKREVDVGDKVVQILEEVP
jgi:hypothetical protein